MFLCTGVKYFLLPSRKCTSEYFSFKNICHISSNKHFEEIAIFVTQPKWNLLSCIKLLDKPLPSCQHSF